MSYFTNIITGTVFGGHVTPALSTHDPDVSHHPIASDHTPEISHHTVYSDHEVLDSHTTELSEHNEVGSHHTVSSMHTPEISHNPAYSEHEAVGSHTTELSEHDTAASHSPVFSEHEVIASHLPMYSDHDPVLSGHNPVMSENIVPRIVRIDVKPGSDPNSINLNGNGVVAVAIFGEPGFDVNDIDVGNVAFGVDPRFDDLHGVPVHSGHIEDVDGDGIEDMVLHFREADLGIDTTLPGETVLFLHLKGQLTDGTNFRSKDEVRITPSNSKARGKGGKGPK